MDKLFPAIITLLIGVTLPIQAAINGKLMRTFGHPIFGAVISFVIGTVILLGYMFAIRARFNFSLIRETEWYHWLGGVIGAAYVMGIIVMIPRLGAAFAFALIVCGQLSMSVVMDQFGWFGVPVNPVNVSKILGLVLLIAGVFLIRGK